MLSENKITDLQETALRIREYIIKMSGDTGCFIKASLSYADILVYLYKEYLNTYKENDSEKDYIFLSQNDIVQTDRFFAEMGLKEKNSFKNNFNSNIFFGNLLSSAIEAALDCKIRNQKNKIIVITGDSEFNNEPNLAACIVASAYKLDNLIIIVDRNQNKSDAEKLIPIEPLFDKFESFGFAVGEIDAHNFYEIDNMFSQLPFEKNKSSVIIADTIRGKGLPGIQSLADKWFCNFTNREIESLLRELHGVEID